MSSTTTSPSSLSSSPSAPITMRRKSRVSAEHTLTRVRENQRRHRARRRDYIQTLEIQLAETELHLEAARAEIAMLRMEREICQRKELESSRTPNKSPTIAIDFNTSFEGGEKPSEQELKSSLYKQPTLDLIPLRQTTGIDTGCRTNTQHPPSESESASDSTISDPIISTSFSTPPSLPLLLLDESHGPECIPMETPTGPPPCCTDTDTPIDPSLPISPPGSNIDVPSSSINPPSNPPLSPNPECTTCALRPLPSASESTTLCSQAYILISQQNFRQIDAGTIRLWLWQGYRRALRRGEGCRVENGVLLSVLDFISGEM